MDYANGQIPDAGLVSIPGGGRLLAGPASAWNAIVGAVQREFGWTPRPTGPMDAYRPLSGNYYAQTETFLRRYTRARLAGRPTKVWNGVTYWLKAGQETAAVPGKSNHGLGCAVDVTGLGGFSGTRYKQFATVAARYGWTNTEGRSIGEPWHWVDVGNAHLVKNGLSVIGVVPTVSAVNTPAPITTASEEDEMIALARLKDQYKDGRVYVGNGVTRTHVRTDQQLKDLQSQIRNGFFKAKTPDVQVVDSLDWLGKEI